jgi:transcriptional regulator
MYDSADFKTGDPEAVWTFMQAHPFVTLCVADAAGKVEATQVPVLLRTEADTLYIRGHVMRKQAHTLAMQEQAEWLFLFQGPHHYISASWYEQPQVASTWNYQTVQARGVGTWLTDEGLWQLLKETTQHFEGGAHTAGAFDQIPADYVEKHMRAIVGFECKVTSLQHVFKLSQNRDEQSFQQIVDKLGQGSAEAKAVAKAMEEERVSSLQRFDR